MLILTYRTIYYTINITLDSGDVYMCNIVYKKIGKKDENQLRNLIDIVLRKLERPEFFIPFTETEIVDMFDENKTVIYGAYDNEKLVGTAQIYLDEEYVKDIKKMLSIENAKALELGGYLVLSNYRNQGIMKNLQNKLIIEAKTRNFKHIIITAHPDNKPSNSVIKSSGAKLVKTTSLEGYLRNIYLLEI